MKALSEELENPMNVHRWRKLEGSDPTTFEMIQKIHTLQKRLISKTEEVCKKLQPGESKPSQGSALLAIRYRSTGKLEDWWPVLNLSSWRLPANRSGRLSIMELRISFYCSPRKSRRASPNWLARSSGLERSLC